MVQKMALLGLLFQDNNNNNNDDDDDMMMIMTVFIVMIIILIIFMMIRMVKGFFVRNSRDISVEHLLSFKDFTW